MSFQGQMWLEIEPSSVQKGSTEICLTGDRPVCIQDHNTTPMILQLETRPGSRGHRCIQTILKAKQLCQPSMGHNPSCHITRKMQKASLVLIAPVWKSQTRYPVLLTPLVDFLLTRQGFNNHPDAHNSSAYQASRGSVVMRWWLFYTGFQSFVALQAFDRYLGLAVDHLFYWAKHADNAKAINHRCRQQTFPPLEKLFMTLVCLQLGLMEYIDLHIDLVYLGQQSPEPFVLGWISCTWN